MRSRWFGVLGHAVSGGICGFIGDSLAPGSSTPGYRGLECRRVVGAPKGEHPACLPFHLPLFSFSAFQLFLAADVSSTTNAKRARR